MNNYLLAAGWNVKNNAFGLRSFRYIPEEKRFDYVGISGDLPSMSSIELDGDLAFSCVETKADDLVCSFKVNADGLLEPVSQVHTKGLSIAHLCLDRAHKTIYVSCFASGLVAMLSYDEKGLLTWKDALSMPDQGSFTLGKSMVERQNASHPHSSQISPDGKLLYVCDVGNDKIYAVRPDHKQGKLELLPDLTTTVAYGEGPRHLSFSKDGHFAYVNTEMGNTIYVFAVSADGAFKEIQKLSSLNPTRENPAKGWAAVNILSDDGKYFYVCNRGQNEIAGYAVDTDGRLTNIGYFACGGEAPRGLLFGFDEQVLFCSCSSSNSIAVLPRDVEAGTIGEATFSLEDIPGASNAAWI